MKAFSNALSYHGTYAKIDIVPQTQNRPKLWQVHPYISGLSKGVSPVTGEQIITASSHFKHLIGLPVLVEGEEKKAPLFFQLLPYNLGELTSYNCTSTVEVSLTLYQEDTKTYLNLRRERPLVLWHHLESHLGHPEKQDEIVLATSGFFLCWNEDSHSYKIRYRGTEDSLVIQEFGVRASSVLAEGLREIATKLRCLLEMGKEK